MFGGGVVVVVVVAAEVLRCVNLVSFFPLNWKPCP